MLKKIWSLVILLLIILLAEGIIISKAENNENIVWEINSEGVLTISGNGEIPDYSYYQNVPWINDCKKIKSAVISDGITSISDMAFYNCTNLKSVYISKTVANIGDYAFQHCDSLSSFEVDPRNLYFSSKNGSLYNRAQNCLLKYTGTETEIVIDNNITQIGNYAFYNKPITKVIFHSGITSIGDSSFSGCTLLEEVVIPDSVYFLENSAFSGCTSLKKVTIGEGITQIKGWTFGGCYMLSEVLGGKNVRSIGSNAFRACYSLDSLNFLPDVTYIDSLAFTYSGLRRVELKNLVEIGYKCFSYCDRLTDVIIGEDIATIGEYAFEECRALKHLDISNSVTTIKPYAFSGCTSLEEINFGENLHTIHSYAFYNCSALTSLSLKSKKLYCIEDKAFYYCDGLKELYLSSSVKKIGNDVFRTQYGPSNISHIYFEGSQESWEGLANGDFYGICYELRYAQKHYNHDLKREYTVTFDDGTGETFSSTLYENDYVISYPALQKDGYIFKGWYANKKGLGEPFVDANGVSVRKINQNITLYPIFEKLEEFTMGYHTFNFRNATRYFTANTMDGYYISDEYANILFDKANIAEEFWLKNKYIKREWNGSCYGMTAVMALAYNGMLDLNFFQKGAQSAYDLAAPYNDGVINEISSSLINYYYLLQYLSDFNEPIHSAEYWGEKIVNGLEAPVGTSNPIIINIKIPRRFTGDKDYIHSILGYKVEDTGKNYKVYIADPSLLTSLSTGEPSSPKEMYISYDFKDISYTTTINAQSFTASTADSSLKITSVIDDMSVFEKYNLQKALTNTNNMDNSLFLASASDNNNIMLETNCNDFTVKTASAQGSVVDDEISGNLQIEEITFEYNSYTYLLGTNECFTVTPGKCDEGCYARSLSENVYMNAYSDTIAEFTFNPANFNLSVTSAEEGAKELSIAYESQLPCDGIHINTYGKSVSVMGDVSQITITSDVSLFGSLIQIFTGENTSEIYVDIDSNEIILFDDNGILGLKAKNDESYAQFCELTHCVQFFSGGGSFIDTYNGLYLGESISQPEAPIRYGYVFSGWYKEPECVNKWDFDSDTIDGDIKLYARWEPDKELHKIVTFQNGNAISQMIVKKGYQLSESDYPEISSDDGILRIWEPLQSNIVNEDIIIRTVNLSQENISVKVLELDYVSGALTGYILTDNFYEGSLLKIIFYNDEGELVTDKTITLTNNTRVMALNVPFESNTGSYSADIICTDEYGNILAFVKQKFWFDIVPELYTFEDYTYLIENNTAVIYECSSNDEEIVIPEKLDGYTVSGIKKLTDQNEYTTAISIPSTVEYIEDSVFNSYGCLESISVDSKYFTSIDGVLFDADTKTLIFYPAAKPANEYTVPKSVEHIKDYAFSCFNLEKLTLHNTLKSVGENSFYYCFNLNNIYFKGSEVQFYTIDGIYESGLVYKNIEFESDSIPQVLHYGYCSVYDKNLYVSVDFDERNPGGALVVAIYDTSGEMVDILTDTVSDTDTYWYAEKNTLSVQVGYTVKIMLFEDMNSIKPLTIPYLTTIQ